jgi:hypothetical protein
MMDFISSLKQKSLSNDVGESVQALDEVMHIIDECGSILLEAVKGGDDRLILCDRISVAFDGYIRKLNNYLDDESTGMDFWAASLIVHYGINNSIAENILLNSVRSGNHENATTATII